ncbi:glycosyltransferase family 4 protein [soil metagenome]
MTRPEDDEVRVLEVLPRSAGGIGHHVSEVVRHLDGRGGLIVDVAGPSINTVAMPKPVIPVAIPDGALGHPAAIARLKTVLDDGSYDVVHAHGLRAGVDGALAARRLRKRSILTVHNLIRDEISGKLAATLLRTMEAAAVRLAHLVFAPSQQIADHLRAAVPSATGKIEVLYLPPELPLVRRSATEVRAELGVTPSERLVVTASRLAPQKALPVMLRAVAQLPGDVVLAVLGEGPEEQELRSLAAELGVAARVRWLGWREDVGDLIAAADVFCMSSVWEAVGLAAQEAVQLGTPVVTTDVGGMRELVADRVSGRLVPKGDGDALAAALDEVAGTAKGAEYADRARRDYESRFSREHTMQRLGQAYLRLARAG